MDKWRVFYNRAVRFLVIMVVVSLHAAAQQWFVQTSGLDTNLRGISVRHYSVKGKRAFAVWASGSNGIILLSTDTGSTWKRLHITGGDDLDFRDIEGFDADTAYVMSSGEGEKSRIYKTTDGGKTWNLQYTDKRPGFFLDSIACDSKLHCVALSDPVEGKFLVLSTDDGEHWRELPRDKMPAILSGEGAFAASGTAIAYCGKGQIFFGTGGGRTARVFHSKHQGQTWRVADAPIASGNASSGIFSVACNGHSVLAVGGDYKEPARAQRVAAYSTDFGETWRAAGVLPGGYRSAVAHDSNGNFVAVGPNGSDVSLDGGAKWKSQDVQNFNAVSFARNEGWAAGPKGTIARFRAPHK
jgi:photosystem II stability/assembly factor-like uncharacterized protein